MAQSSGRTERADIAPMRNWLYDLILWSFSVLVDLFFREVHPRGSWKIPRRGPVIFVAAPHANQFVDPLILMRVVRTEARRRIAILVAEKSMRRKFIGAISRLVGAVPVGRALDSTKPAAGRIYLPANSTADEDLLIQGHDTRFQTEAMIGGLVVLPTVNGIAANAEIAEVISDTEIKLKRAFKGHVALSQLTGRPLPGDEESSDGITMRQSIASENQGRAFQGIEFKLAPKVDQSLVYNAVFDRLQSGGCVGIFPEGGSHDRTELLPLKAGVAIMALGSLAANPDSGLKIVPCGMNYFHAHKFRSRAVVEFGSPVEVPRNLVELYKSGERREATRQLLDTVYQSLVAVTVTSPDYDTLMLIQAARRLYKPTGKKLPLPMIVELNRRLVKGYTHYKNDPRIVNLKKSVSTYNKQLWLLGVRDHQVEYAKSNPFRIVFTLVYRLGKLCVLAIGTLPGLGLFAPVFIASKLISIRKSREALAASTVKLQGRDVMATWKLLVAMAMAPSLYIFYTVILTWWAHRNRVQGWVPERVPLWIIPVPAIVFFVSITFAALRFGEIGMDILKSLRPLVLSLNPTSANTLVKLRHRREILAHQVTELINTLGPELYPDFDSARIVADPFRENSLRDLDMTVTNRHQDDTTSPTDTTTLGQSLSHESNRFSTSQSTSVSNLQMPEDINSARMTYDPADASITTSTTEHASNLPRNESFHNNIGSIGLFASQPPSPSRSRSRHGSRGGSRGGSASFTMLPKSQNTISAKPSLDEVSRKIRGAMRERGKERRRKSDFDDAVSTGFELGTSISGPQTPD